jgi:hypothetical protein
MDMTKLAWLASAILGLFGGLAIVGNYWIAVRWYAWRKHSSMIPLIGGVLFAAAMFICPIQGVRRYAWIPLVADLGCAPLFAGCIYEYFSRRGNDNDSA